MTKKKSLASRIIRDFYKRKSVLQVILEPKSKKKERKVDETPLRSFLKTMSFRVVEVIVDSLLLLTIHLNFGENVLVSIGIEFICWVLSFIWERIWNKIDFGRKVKCPHCNKEI